MSAARRDKISHEVAGDRYQVDKAEHWGADDPDISIDCEEPDPGPVEDPTDWFAKIQKLAKEDDVTISRMMCASVQDGPRHGRLGSRLLPRSSLAAL